MDEQLNEALDEMEGPDRSGLAARFKKAVEDAPKDPPKKSRTKRVAGAKVGRNAKCPCGSGHKMKHCCGHRVRGVSGMKEVRNHYEGNRTRFVLRGKDTGVLTLDGETVLVFERYAHAQRWANAGGFDASEIRIGAIPDDKWEGFCAEFPHHLVTEPLLVRLEQQQRSR